MNRGDIYDVEFPGGKRPAVIATRETAIPILRNLTLVPITTSIRGLVTEVPVGKVNGLNLESVASCDNVTTVSKSLIGKRRGSLDPEQLFRFNVGLKIALGIE